MSSFLRTPPYIPIRNDDGLKSLSVVERDFVQGAASKNRTLRTDGRRSDHVRPHQVQLVRGENTATATVTRGTSRVTCTCSAQLVPPFPDRPNQGLLALSVDLSPSASTSFRQALPVSTGGSTQRQQSKGGQPDETQKLLTNRILRSVERLLAAVLDTEALVVIAGCWVWKLELSVTILDAAGGNLLDASVLSAMAAVRHYRKPHVEHAITGDSSTTTSASPI